MEAFIKLEKSLILLILDKKKASKKKGRIVIWLFISGKPSFLVLRGKTSTIIMIDFGKGSLKNQTDAFYQSVKYILTKDHSSYPKSYIHLTCKFLLLDCV